MTRVLTRISGFLAGAVAMVLYASAAQAVLVGGPDILLVPPTSVIDDPPGAVNTHQQAFDEALGVTLMAAIAVDGPGTIAAGETVDSHMIFLNTLGGTRVDDRQTWTFDGIILGVMSNIGGSLEAATNGLLGNALTTYPGAFANRGLEQNKIASGDGYIVPGKSIDLRMVVTEPGDWIRVVTRSVPEPATLALPGVALVGLGPTRRRKH